MKQDLFKYIDSIDTIDELRVIWDRISARNKELQRLATYSFNVGNEVSFRSKSGRTVFGRVTKINGKTIKVKDNVTGLDWRVSPGLLTKVAKVVA